MEPMLDVILPSSSSVADLRRVFDAAGSVALRGLVRNPSAILSSAPLAPEDALLQSLDAAVVEWTGQTCSLDHLRACRGELRTIEGGSSAVWDETRGEFRPIGIALNVSRDANVEVRLRRGDEVEHEATLDPGDALLGRTPPGLRCEARSRERAHVFFGWFLRLVPWAGKPPPDQALTVPWRTAYAVFDALAPFIAGKSVFEVGCGAGDSLVYMRDRLGATVSGIESDTTRSPRAAERGLGLVDGNAWFQDFPKADTYYAWLAEYPLERRMIETIPSGTILIAEATDCAPWDDHVYERHPEKDALARHLRHFPSARVIEIPYSEGTGWREAGVFSVLVVEK